MDTTTTRISLIEALRAVPASMAGLDSSAVDEAARTATLAQNLAGATRLLAAHRLVESIRAADLARYGDAESDTRAAHARLDPASQARDVVSGSMKLTVWHAGQLVTAGTQIHTRLHRLRKAVSRGLFPEQLAIDTACRLAGIDDAILPAVESDVVGALARALDGGHRPSRTELDTAVDAARERHDPEGAQIAVSQAAEKRTVRFRPGRDGMTDMWAHLPAADAEKLRRRIEAAARAAYETGHPRTRDQLRADALVALGDPNTTDIADPTDPDDRTGTPPLGASWGTDKPVRICVIDGRPQGLPNRVKHLDGAYASFDWLCEELLSGGDLRVRFDHIDPQPGAADNPDTLLRYVITPALAERIRLRDGTCRHPGCTVDAHSCDIDHCLAFDHNQPQFGGPTAEWNLMCLCRKHHLEKTFGYNAYRPGPLGELIITTGTGQEMRTTPTGPLAQARDQILDHAWKHHIDRMFTDHGDPLTNPPGADRPRHRDKPGHQHKPHRDGPKHRDGPHTA